MTEKQKIIMTEQRIQLIIHEIHTAEVASHAIAPMMIHAFAVAHLVMKGLLEEKVSFDDASWAVVAARKTYSEMLHSWPSCSECGTPDECGSCYKKMQSFHHYLGDILKKRST